MGRDGPLPFSRYVELALYAPGGFYAAGGGAGRRGDFLTSPEVGPLFGTVLARALDRCWEQLGRPSPFTVVEAGGGSGTLARSVLDAGPACGGALRYVVVERSATLRARSAALVPEARAVADLPAGPLTGMVLANELLDNLPFDLLERRSGSWHEVRVDCAGGGGEGLVEALVPAVPADAAAAEALAPDAPESARIPLQREAAAWPGQALAVLGAGRVLAVDYGARTADLARRPWTEWVRTYRAHGRGGHPLDDPGTQDVTCEVALDQLRPPPAVDRSQADFLRAHGIDALAAEAAAEWRRRAAVGGLAALAARSRATEAAALTDPAGLGAFRALEWTAG